MLHLAGLHLVRREVFSLREPLYFAAWHCSGTRCARVQNGRRPSAHPQRQTPTQTNGRRHAIRGPGFQFDSIQPFPARPANRRNRRQIIEIEKMPRLFGCPGAGRRREGINPTTARIETRAGKHPAGRSRTLFEPAGCVADFRRGDGERGVEERRLVQIGNRGFAFRPMRYPRVAAHAQTDEMDELKL